MNKLEFELYLLKTWENADVGIEEIYKYKNTIKLLIRDNRRVNVELINDVTYSLFSELKDIAFYDIFPEEGAIRVNDLINVRQRILAELIASKTELID